MISTRIYKLFPTAPPNDSNWGRALCQGDVVVRARSTGEARAVAARAEAYAAGLTSRTTSQAMASAFLDPVLYGVATQDGGEFASDGPAGVLSGDFRVPPGWVSHDD